MQTIIGARLLASKVAQPRATPFEIRDSRLPGFLVRVQPSGVCAYYAQLGRGRRVKLGRVGQLTPDEARERCEQVFGNVAHGRAPFTGIDGAEAITFGTFLDDTYAPWCRANRPKHAERTLQRIETCFGAWRALPLDQISVERIENWKSARLAEGLSPATILRDVMTLSGVLTRAVKLRKLADNPVRHVDKPRIDRSPKVRFLSSDEEKHLRAALTERDRELCEARESANRWRKARKQAALPTLAYYGDHLTPAVLLSMNTGLRRGELLALTWSAIDFRHKLLTIEGDTSKTTQTRHVPLNAEALEVLTCWREQRPDGERIFPIASGFKTAWAALLKRAGITRFRWHDLRHNFGSRLAQAGIPLNTIRELLGHESLAMTLRYAHLQPDQHREAVARLVTAQP
jgi:integrase